MSELTTASSRSPEPRLGNESPWTTSTISRVGNEGGQSETRNGGRKVAAVPLLERAGGPDSVYDCTTVDPKTGPEFGSKEER